MVEISYYCVECVFEADNNPDTDADTLFTFADAVKHIIATGHNVEAHIIERGDE